MIGRIWRGRVRARDVAEYRERIRKTGLADYAATPGNRLAAMLTRIDGDEAEVITISFWDDLQSIEAFAGSDISLARYYDDIDHLLLEKPLRVEHYEVDFAALPPIPQ